MHDGPNCVRPRRSGLGPNHLSESKAHSVIRIASKAMLVLQTRAAHYTPASIRPIARPCMLASRPPLHASLGPCIPYVPASSVGYLGGAARMPSVQHCRIEFVSAHVVELDRSLVWTCFGYSE
jgi:hypothetical protein